MLVSGRGLAEPIGAVCSHQADRQSDIADRHTERYADPEILALLARAEAAVLRTRELSATMDKLSRALADAVQRTDEWLAARKLDAGHASDADVSDHTPN
jgi:hypothetical protein